jgi:SAM-dependent methyltransferase
MHAKMRDDLWLIHQTLSCRELADRRCVILDLGGGAGVLREPIEARGHRYVNLDIDRWPGGEPSVIADAHQLPFSDGVFDVVISRGSFNLFSDPDRALLEIKRVLKAGGYFVITLPFLQPFHGDFHRYTPHGLARLLRSFEITRLDSHRWIFSAVGIVLIETALRTPFGFLAPPVRNLCTWLDEIFTRSHDRPRSFAYTYRAVARNR